MYLDISCFRSQGSLPSEQDKPQNSISHAPYFSQGKWAGPGPMAWHPVFSLGKEKACVE